MKLPFAFGIKLIFRLVLPGAILAAALAPAVHGLLHAFGIWIKIQYLFPFEIIAWGWIIVVCDMRIYMLFEGRRYWPRRLRQLLVQHRQQQLSKLKDIVDAPPMADRRRYDEACVEYGLYPIDEGGNAYVEHPTRLGNIIEAFETYPKVKYGLDAVFYWYRLWVALDKDLREEIDTAQALVDSAVYIAFALHASAIVIFIYAGIGFATYVQLPYVPSPSALLALGAGCFLIAYLVYWLSLFAHVQFGELFKSVFDEYRSKLVFDDVLKEVGRIIGDPALSYKTQREKNQIVWRYLRWHLIRDEAGKNMTVAEWEERQKTPNSRHPL
jgi:hypothetical protein